MKDESVHAWNMAWRRVWLVRLCLQKTPMAAEKEEEEAEAEVQPDPLNQLILHFSHNALTERRSHMILQCIHRNS